MGHIDDPLWHALVGMRIEPEGASLTFTRRLARENGWSRTYAAAVVLEYRRFLYLAATGDTTVTPSQQVDQAWHLHLAYTRHYWGELCAHIIGRPLHHGPTAGGSAEGRKYRNLYAETLTRYREVFGAEPSPAIWPDGDQRFAGDYQWVDRSRHVLLPRRAVSIAGMTGAATLLAACTALAADNAGGDGSSAFDRVLDVIFGSDIAFFGFIILMFIVLVVIINTIDYLRGGRGRTARRRRNPRDNRDSGGSSDIGGDGWSSGGSGAAAGGAAFMAGGGDFGGSGADGGWDSDSGSSGGGDSSSGGDSGCSSGCGGGCGGD